MRGRREKGEGRKLFEQEEEEEEEKQEAVRKQEDEAECKRFSRQTDC